MLVRRSADALAISNTLAWPNGKLKRVRSFEQQDDRRPEVKFSEEIALLELDCAGTRLIVGRKVFVGKMAARPRRVSVCCQRLQQTKQDRSVCKLDCLSTTSNVTGRQRGPKQKLRAGYRELSLQHMSYLRILLLCCASCIFQRRM